MTSHFVEVTEMDGQPVSREQLERTCDRYHWAAANCIDADVLEVACGAGQGFEILRRVARSVTAGDISPEVLMAARRVAGDAVRVDVFGAELLPFEDDSFDRVLLFEALYYLQHPERFASEARRVLRPGGKVLLVTANKDLFDFNPSPFSQRYLGVPELAELFAAAGFRTEFYASHDVSSVSMRQRLFRPVKFAASRLGLIPKTMGGKAWLKRLVFGKLVPMPASLHDVAHQWEAPAPIPGSSPDNRHKVLYCIAALAAKNA